MLNTKDFYVALGKAAATATNQHDYARFRFHNSHFHRAKALEFDECKPVADEYYNEGYAAVRHLSKMEDFK